MQCQRKIERDECRRRYRRGFSLLELIAVVSLVGVVSAIVVMRVNSDDRQQVQQTSASVDLGDIDLQIQLYFRNTGSWPLANLSDIGGDTDYFPNGLPECPVEGMGYRFNVDTRRAEMVSE